MARRPAVFLLAAAFTLAMAISSPAQERQRIGVAFGAGAAAIIDLVSPVPASIDLRVVAGGNVVVNGRMVMDGASGTSGAADGGAVPLRRPPNPRPPA